MTSTRAAVDVREPDLPRSCRIAISEARPKKRSWRMPSHTSHATPGKLNANLSRRQHSGAHTSVCIRSIAVHVNRANTVRIRLQIRDRSADTGTSRRLLERSQVSQDAGLVIHSQSVSSTAAQNMGSFTRRHRNTHTKTTGIGSLPKLTAPPTRNQHPILKHA